MRIKKKQRTDTASGKTVINMGDIDPTISLITLNVNGLNIPFKSTDCLTGQKKNPIMYLP